MNQGVEILIARIESHPEEFDGAPIEVVTGYATPRGKWGHAVNTVYTAPYFTDEERTLLRDKLKERRRTEFTESIMRMLLGEDDAPQEDAEAIAKQKAYAAMAQLQTRYDAACDAYRIGNAMVPKEALMDRAQPTGSIIDEWAHAIGLK